MMSLKDFSLLKEDDDNYHIGTPSGRSFQLAKKGLSENAHKKVKSLKAANHMADGGMAVNVDPNQTPDFSALQNEQLPQPPPDTSSTTGFAAGDYRALPNKYIDPSQMLQQAQQQPMVVNPNPTANLPPNPMDTNAKQISGALDSAASAANQAAGIQKQSSQLLDQLQPGLQAQLTPDQQMAKQAQDHYSQINTALEARNADLAAKFGDGTIDPQRFVKNMSTGDKIMSTIGLILGGLGAHAYGGHNIALDVLNKHIDQDIAAQQQDKSNIMNAWKMNMATSQNAMEAMLKTKQQYITGIQALTNLQAQKSGNALAAAQAQMLNANAEQMKRQLLMQESALRMMNGGNGQVDPAQKIRMMQMTGMLSDQDAQKAYDNLDKAQNLNSESGTILNLFDKGSNENTVLKTGAGLIRTPASITGFRAALMPYLKDAEGRINEQEMKTAFAMEPKPGDTDEKIAEKRANLQSWLKEKASTAQLRGIGINPKPTINFRSR